MGSRCVILHGVTLGAVGKPPAAGDGANCLKGESSTANRRHPIIGNEVQIGCNAVILGAICVGDGAKVGSSSVVLKSVPARCTAVGSPARIKGRSYATTSAGGEGVDTYTVAGEDSAAPDPESRSRSSDVYLRTWTLWADCIHIFNSASTATAASPDASATLSPALPAPSPGPSATETETGSERQILLSLSKATAAWAAAI